MVVFLTCLAPEMTWMKRRGSFRRWRSSLDYGRTYCKLLNILSNLLNTLSKLSTGLGRLLGVAFIGTIGNYQRRS